MTKTTIIICDECDADITKASIVYISWCPYGLPSLDQNIHFCGYKHMYAYLNKNRPDDIEAIND